MFIWNNSKFLKFKTLIISFRLVIL